MCIHVCVCAGGALGAAEGISYLVVVGIVAWSIATKVCACTCSGSAEVKHAAVCEGGSHINFCVLSCTAGPGDVFRNPNSACHSA